MRACVPLCRSFPSEEERNEHTRICIVSSSDQEAPLAHPSTALNGEGSAKALGVQDLFDDLPNRFAADLKLS